MSDYDSRRFRLMLSVLGAFDERAIGLGKAIADLEVLFRSLRDTAEAWTGVFYKQWAILEEIYAVALDRGFSQLPPGDQKLVEGVMRTLRQLVQERIDATADAEK